MNASCLGQEDPITTEIITEENVVSFYQFNKLFCFTVDTLIELYLNGNTNNPLNNTPLPENLVAAIRLLVEERNVTVNVILNTSYDSSIIKRFKIYPTKSIGDLIVEFYRSIGDLERIGKDDSSLYSYNLDMTIEDYANFNKPSNILNALHEKIDILRGTLPGDVPIGTSRYLNVTFTSNVLSGDIGVRYNRLYKYARQKHIIWLMDLIHDDYKRNPPRAKLPEVLDSKIIIDSIQYIYDKSFNYKYKYAISILPSLFISAEAADYFANNFATNQSVPRTDMNMYYQLIELLYSRVADPWNIKSKIGLPYKRSIFTPPFIV